MPSCASEGCKGIRVTHAASNAQWQCRDAKGGLYAAVVSRVFPARASLASRFPDFAPLKAIAALYGQAVVIDEGLWKPFSSAKLVENLHSQCVSYCDRKSQ